MAFAILPVAVLLFLIFGLAFDYPEWEFAPISSGLEFLVFIASLAYAIYAVLSFEKVKHQGTKLEKGMRIWLMTLISCYLGGVLIDCIYVFVYAVTDESVYLWLTDTIISFVIVSVLLIQGLRTKVLIHAKTQVGIGEIDRWQELFILINAVVIKDELFLKHDVRVDDLARMMDSNSKYVSRAINEGGGREVGN